MHPTPNRPTNTEVDLLVAALLSNQATAPAEVAEAFLELLAVCLRGRFHELDGRAIAARLACPPERLAAVRLSRAPRPGREDVLSVATRFGLDAPALAEVAKYTPASSNREEVLAEPACLVLVARDRESPS